jgi:hypothetical protein
MLLSLVCNRQIEGLVYPLWYASCVLLEKALFSLEQDEAEILHDTNWSRFASR